MLRPSSHVEVHRFLFTSLPSLPTNIRVVVPRAGGKGEIYAYIPLLDHNTERLLDIPPESHKNPDYGFSVGRGAWKFPKGTWTTIAERVKLNNVGEADGEVQLWIDGVSVIHATELILREDAESHVKGMHFQTFFGGELSVFLAGHLRPGSWVTIP